MCSNGFVTSNIASTECRATLEELDVYACSNATLSNGLTFEEDGDESSNAVGGTALFDSIDLMRQAVEFLTVTK